MGVTNFDSGAMCKVGGTMYFADMVINFVCIEIIDKTHTVFMGPQVFKGTVH